MNDLGAQQRLRPWHSMVATVGERLAARGNERPEDLPGKWERLVLKWRQGADREAILVEALELSVQAAHEACELVLHPGQLLGALALSGGTLVEMQTGEGKTIVAAVAACLCSLDRQGVHVATMNDYLVDRDRSLNQSLFTALGLTAGAIVQTTPDNQRREAYSRDITYSTARELAFDFLRDSLRSGCHPPDVPLGDVPELPRSHDGRTVSRVQPRRHIALVDEADSLLIDEARIPFVLAQADLAAVRQQRLIEWAVDFVPSLRETTDCLPEPRTGRWILSATGREVVRSNAPVGEPVFANELYQAVELVLRASRDLLRDRDYLVREGKIVLVDEFTGRLGEGRQWPAGLHQAVEAWCGLSQTPRTRPAARITAQEFFRGYARLGGLTGTAEKARGEFRSMYGCEVATLPTHLPCQRVVWPLRVLTTEEVKFREVIAETWLLHREGRPVLVGTRSIDKTERLSALLRADSIPHQILHAKHLADEARRVALAGQAGQITLATNLAGRGTDIELGPGVAQRGGLHVIGTELHESSRIDRQLFGRCARQGDPGSCRQFLSLEDALLETAWGAARAGQIRQQALAGHPAPQAWGRVLLQAQSEVERRMGLARQALVRETGERNQRLRRLGFNPVVDFLDEE
jgi:preprotein translocase subunit SecA